MIKPPDFKGLDGEKRGVNFPLIPKRWTPRREETRRLAWSPFHREPLVEACQINLSAGIYSYEPLWVVKLVIGTSSLQILIWWYPDHTSILESTVALASWWNRSAIRSNGILQNGSEVRVPSDQNQKGEYSEDDFHYSIWLIWVYPGRKVTMTSLIRRFPVNWWQSQSSSLSPSRRSPFRNQGKIDTSFCSIKFLKIRWSNHAQEETT